MTQGNAIEVWQTPNHLVREFAPFTLHRRYTGHHDDVLSIQWSPDSRCFITTSRDMTARLFTLDTLPGFRPKTFAGHRDAVIAAYFSIDGETVGMISRGCRRPLNGTRSSPSARTAQSSPGRLNKRTMKARMMNPPLQHQPNCTVALQPPAGVSTSAITSIRPIPKSFAQPSTARQIS